MPKGFAGIKEALAEIEARKAAALEESGDNDFKPSLWFKLPESAVGKAEEEITNAMFAQIRPLEGGEDVAYAAIHNVELTGYQFGIDIVCRDQYNRGEDCPGCEMGLKRKMKGWLNVIWRDAPDFPTDEKTGKYITKVEYTSLPTSDKVAILSSGPQLFGRFDELNEENDGLDTREYTITRKGLGLATKYTVKAVKGSDKPLSKADKALAAEKPDLNHFIAIPTREEWVAKAQGQSPNGAAALEASTTSTPSPFNTAGRENIFTK